jgi:hypothetical protein
MGDGDPTGVRTRVSTDSHKTCFLACFTHLGTPLTTSDVMLFCYAQWQAYIGKKEDLLGTAPTPTKMEPGTLKALAPLTKRKRVESAM